MIKIEINKIVSLFIIFIIVAFVFHRSVLSQEQSPEIQVLKNKFITYIENNEFKEASNLFHYPSEYSTEEMIKEKESVKASLERFKNTFGNIERISVFRNIGKAIGIGVSGSDIRYWQKNFKTIPQLLFLVQFEKAGEGFVRFGFCQINSEWKIQGVDYTLPDSEASQAIIKKLSKE